MFNCVVCKRPADREDYCFGCRNVVCENCTGDALLQFYYYSETTHTLTAHFALMQLDPVRRN